MTPTRSIDIVTTAAVTAVGLTAAQTCAAIRANIKRISPIEAQIVDWREAKVGARVSADPRLRIDEREWLLNLAGRALRECEPDADPDTALVWLVPEAHREHPLVLGVSDGELLNELERHIGRQFSPHSRVLHGGAAAVIEALAIARELFEAGAVRRCLIGGADSLLRRVDLERLERANRLLGATQSQGLVPGEGAAFMLVGRHEPDPKAPARARVHGLGLGYEPNTVLGSEYSVGDGFAAALEAALADAGLSEAEVAFVAGNFNGERYDAWERAHGHSRNYRTRRERLHVAWPAASVGELGVAGGVMALIYAAAAIDGEFAPGPIATVEARSDGQLRGIAIVHA
jgi:3-oxoacyl-[acyl-carrier-protein] synthase-1